MEGGRIGRSLVKSVADLRGGLRTGRRGRGKRRKKGIRSISRLLIFLNLPLIGCSERERGNLVDR